MAAGVAAKELIQVIITAVDRASGPLRRIAASAAAPIAAMSGVGRAAGGVATQLSGMLGPVAAIGGALTAAGIGRALTQFSSLASNINDTTKQVGVGAQRLQELRYVSDIAGVAQASLEGGLKHVSKTLNDIATGGAPEARETLRQLGVSVRDSNGQLRSADAVMVDLVSRFDRIKNPTVQAAAAMAVFGQNGQEMLPFLSMGGDEFERLRLEAHRLGLVLKGDAISSGAAFGNTLKLLRNTLMGLSLAISSSLAPVLGPLIERFQQWTEANRELLASRITDMISRFADAIQAVDWSAWGAALSNVAGVLGRVSDLLGSTGSLLVALGVVFAPLVASVGSLAWAFGGLGLSLLKFVGAITIGPTIAAFVAALKAGTGVVFAFNWALAANPIGLVIAGVAALGAAGWLLYENWDAVVSGLGKAWDWLRDKIASVIAFYLKAYGAAADLLPDWMGGGKVSAKLEQYSRDVREWGRGDRPESLSAEDAAAASGGTARVDGEIAVRFENAPPGMRVQRSNAGNVPMQTDVGYAPVFLAP